MQRDPAGYVLTGGDVDRSTLPDAERARLRDLSQALRPKEHGLIVRTAAEGVSQDDLERDLARLLEIWESIEKKAASAKAPALIYAEPELELPGNRS